MNVLLEYFKRAKTFIFKYKIFILFSLAAIFLLLSFVIDPTEKGLDRKVKRLEKSLHERQSLLDAYVNKTMEIPINEWISFEDFPDDMVIYRYNNDTIQSWINEFPINNDKVEDDAMMLFHRIKPMDSRFVYGSPSYANDEDILNSPLKYLKERDQYVNLGSAWYVVKVYKVGNVKIISGLLIKTDYLKQNAILKSRVNSNLKLSGRMSINPILYNDGYIVKGVDGENLFVVVDDISTVQTSGAMLFVWISLFFILWGLYILLYRKRTIWSFLVYLVGIVIVRYVCFLLVENIKYDLELFSSNLYADNGLFSSLGNLLLNNLFVFVIVIGIFILRKKIIRYLHSISSVKKKILLVASFVFPFILFLYINFTLDSVIENSNIGLELYRLEMLSVYSILVYISFGLLFLALLLLLQIIVVGFELLRKNALFTIKNILIYVVIISLYSLITISYKNEVKEGIRVKVWADKLSVDRDVSLELQLRLIEKKLLSDPLVRSLVMKSDFGVNDKLKSRIEDEYLSGFIQKYDIFVNVCKPNDILSSRFCEEVYREKLMYASPLFDNSNFFYVNNFNGKISYLGVIIYPDSDGKYVTMYIELESKYKNDVVGYSALLFDNKYYEKVNLPREYSYARYLDGKLILYGGTYNYPLEIDTAKFANNFERITKDKYIHYINTIKNDNLVFISRPKRNVYPYIVSFSYLMLFFSGLIFSFLRLRKLGKTRIKFELPKNSFRRKITYLLIISLVVSLISMGLGSVWFCINYYNKSNRLQMEEKLSIVHSTVADACKYAYSYKSIDTSTFFQAIDRLAANNQIDINIYNPYGRLMRSTQNELFDNFLLSSRINSKAYEQIIYKNKKQVENKEKLAELSYTSLYAPIFNTQGDLIAIINIPYFFKENIITNDVSTILAAIINIYILLLIAAILGGAIVSNQLSKPLAELSKKMQYIDVSTKAEHIDYKSKDELGILVNAYNKMIDDLEESSFRLAQTEREKAWSEMARQIAHEIKNPLTPMRLSIQHLIRLKQKGVDGWEQKFEDVAGSILEQIDILSNTASEFSSFAKFYYEENSVLNLYQLISEQKTLFDTRDNIRIAYYYCSQECDVYARRGQIIRVIVNLLSNAIQAVEDSGRGYIKISLNESDGFYSVSFEDNGCGVKEEDESKLFKPNFTTKSSGTGLGLAISKNIIGQSGGKIFYNKSEFGGACFTFTLPKHTC